jgi:hypothetical protein
LEKSHTTHIDHWMRELRPLTSTLLCSVEVNEHELDKNEYNAAKVYTTPLPTSHILTSGIIGVDNPMMVSHACLTPEDEMPQEQITSCTTRVVSWNVNSLHAAVVKGDFEPILDHTDADIYLFQEVMCKSDSHKWEIKSCIRHFNQCGYKCYWNAATRNNSGYGGCMC